MSSTLVTKSWSRCPNSIFKLQLASRATVPLSNFLRSSCGMLSCLKGVIFEPQLENCGSCTTLARSNCDCWKSITYFTARADKNCVVQCSFAQRQSALTRTIEFAAIKTHSHGARALRRTISAGLPQEKKRISPREEKAQKKS